MLYSYITKNLIGLQDVILRKVEQNETSIYIYLQMPRKAHTCPCCGKSTDKSNIVYLTLIMIPQIRKDFKCFGVILNMLFYSAILA